MKIASNAMRLVGRARSAALRFAFAPASPAPLAVLRIGLGAVLLFQAALVAPAFFDLAGSDGLLQGPVRGGYADPRMPCIGWLVGAFAHLGVGERPVLVGAGLAYVFALLALTAGLWTRAAAAVVWLIHLMLMMTANRSIYGVDELANIFLFYLIWIPSGATLSLDARRRRVTAEPSEAARLALRVIQIHLCVVYLMSGVEKALGRQWWTGDAMWRSLMLPEFNQLDFSFLAGHPWMAKAMGWTVLLLEAGYPIFIWPRRTRRPWIAATVALHAGISLFMGLHVFGGIMVVFTVAAFGVPADPALPSPSAAVARQWTLRLLGVLGAITVCAELVRIIGAGPVDHGTVPIIDLGVVAEPP
jgi:hypothetical protein